jgi:micrococcal nuclease
MKKLLLVLALGLSSFVPTNVCEEYNAKVLSVYDGDTITCLIEVGFGIKLEESIRLYGIDAPEVRGSERPQGLIARDSLRNLLLGKEITLKSMGRGKYGRIIGDLYIGTINVSDWLVEKGLAEYKSY